LSYAECAPHAYSAASEASDIYLEQILGNLNLGLKEASSQRDRCQQAFKERLDMLVAGLPPEQGKVVIENGSLLARQWMTVVPRFASQILSNTEIGGALRLRTLYPESSTCCPECALPNRNGHIEVCGSRPNFRTARHETIKRLLVKHLKLVPGNSVEIEPIVQNSNLRTDFRVTGSAAFLRSVSEFDLTVVSMHTVKARSLESSECTPDYESRLVDIHKHLNMMAGEKESKYSGKTLSPFFPLVFTAGGLMEKRTAEVMDSWKDLVPSYRQLTEQVSLALLRARVGNMVW
jgi:hypothetical protein